MTSESQGLSRGMHLGGSTRGEIVQPIMELRNLNVYYGDFHAVRDISLDVGANQITAFIGPSGCGKSTVLRCLNRTNDLVPSARVAGGIDYLAWKINRHAGTAITITPWQRRHPILAGHRWR